MKSRPAATFLERSYDILETLSRCTLRSAAPVTHIFFLQSFLVLRQAEACTKGSGIYTVHRQHKRLPVSFFHNAGDVPSDACWVHAVLLVRLHLTDAPGDAPAVFIIAENAFLTCFCKPGADVTQLYNSNMDAVGFDFVCKSVRIRRNGGFACGVEGLERNVCYGSNRADVHNMPLPLTA